MRVSDELHVEWVEGEAVVLDKASGELHYLNGTAALVFALMQEHGYDAALKEIDERYGAEVQPELEGLVEDMKTKNILLDD